MRDQRYISKWFMIDSPVSLKHKNFISYSSNTRQNFLKRYSAMLSSQKKAKGREALVKCVLRSTSF